MSASVDKENLDQWVEDFVNYFHLDEHLNSNQVVLVKASIKGEFAALKQELKQSLEARVGKDENVEAYHITAVGEKRNELRADFRKAIQAVFQDKGDNRE